MAAWCEIVYLSIIFNIYSIIVSIHKYIYSNEYSDTHFNPRIRLFNGPAVMPICRQKRILLVEKYNSTVAIMTYTKTKYSNDEKIFVIIESDWHEERSC